MQLHDIDAAWYNVALGSEIMSRFRAPSQRRKMIFTSIGQPEPASTARTAEGLLDFRRISIRTNCSKE